MNVAIRQREIWYARDFCRQFLNSSKWSRGGSRMISAGGGGGGGGVRLDQITLRIRTNKLGKKCRPRSDAAERGV